MHITYVRAPRDKTANVTSNAIKNIGNSETHTREINKRVHMNAYKIQKKRKS